MSIHLRIFCVALCVLFLGCEAGAQSPAPGASAQKRLPNGRRAVLIGIDDYSASQFEKRSAPVAERDWPNLYGPVNDVEAMQEMLVARYDFRPDAIVVLKNQAATRDAILRAIDEHLERSSAAGDVAFFYYAGHGSQVPNAKSSEQDKLDESLVPADSRAGAPDIRDKELRRRFNSILDRGVRLTVLLDSCHSGSGGRGLPSDARVRAVRPDTRDANDGEAEGPRPEDRGALILSASQDSDRAHEIRVDTGATYGVFSWAWLRAMRSAADGERAIDTFLRAQAMVRAETPFQEPVVAGNDTARFSPFLGTQAKARSTRPVVALEQVQSDGVAVLQGGWAHGLTIGSELRPANGKSDLRLEVTAFRGLARCEARVAKNAAGETAEDLAPGTLYEVATWAAPPGKPLRVWMPSVGNSSAMVTWAAELAQLARRKRIRWIDDPIEETPASVLRWHQGAWELIGEKGTISRFAANAAPETVLATIRHDTSLFVQLPASPALVCAIAVGPGTRLESIEPVARPEDADYILAGRFHGGRLEYAWVRPAVMKGDQNRTPLPLRTAWHVATTEGNRTALTLQDAAVRLRRVQGWQLLQAPVGAEPPFALSILRRSDGAAVRDVLSGGEQYALALQPRGSVRGSRFIYIFTIDSHGKGILLFPPSGSVENRIPVGASASEVQLNALFDIAEPYGTDTYFLLTTDEPLPDPWILEWDGVRGGSDPKTALGELLANTGSGTRSARAIRTPANWSIERVLFESVPSPSRR